MRALSLCFAAGAFGGLVNSLVVWVAGDMGLMAKIGVAMHPKFTLAWLYPRIVWGGLWGLCFLLPLARKNTFARGFLISLGPTLATLLYFLPHVAGKGLAGLSLGTMTPFVVLAANAVWGWTAALWLRLAKE